MGERHRSFLSVASCVRKLVDVSQVGVVEDDFDSIQRLCLSYPLQLHLLQRHRRKLWEDIQTEARQNRISFTLLITETVSTMRALKTWDCPGFRHSGYIQFVIKSKTVLCCYKLFLLFTDCSSSFVWQNSIFRSVLKLLWSQLRPLSPHLQTWVHRMRIPHYLKRLRKFDKVLLDLLADIQLRLQPLGFILLIQHLTLERTLQRKPTDSMRTLTLPHHYRSEINISLSHLKNYLNKLLRTFWICSKIFADGTFRSPL